MCLTNLSLALRVSGRVEEAQAAAEEGIEVFRELAKENPSRFGGALAKGLNNLGIIWLELSRLGNALLALQEAVELARGLTGIGPDTRQELLAGTLNNLGNVLGYLGQLEEAAGVTEESVAITTALARERPRRFSENLKQIVFRLDYLLTAIRCDPRDNKVLQEALVLLKQMEQVELQPAPEPASGPSSQDE